MPHANASAPTTADPSLRGGAAGRVPGSFARTGRGNIVLLSARPARSCDAGPTRQAWAAYPLQDRLGCAPVATRPLVTFLMLHRGLRPGYDYLLERKLSSRLAGDRQAARCKARSSRFLAAAEQSRVLERVRLSTGSQVPARLLIQTGRRIEELVQGRPGRVRGGLSRADPSHRDQSSSLPVGDQQRPNGPFPPRRPRSVAPLRWAGAAGRAARAGAPRRYGWR